MSASTRAPAVGAIGGPKERSHCVFSQTPRLMNAGDRFVFFRVVSGKIVPGFRLEPTREQCKISRK